MDCLTPAALRCDPLTFEEGTVTYGGRDSCQSDQLIVGCTATYSCGNSTLVLDGAATRNCMPNSVNDRGVWSGSTPDCVEGNLVSIQCS